MFGSVHSPDVQYLAKRKVASFVADDQHESLDKSRPKIYRKSVDPEACSQDQLERFAGSGA